MSLKSRIQEFRKFARIDDARVEGCGCERCEDREKNVPKSKMRTPAPPPTRRKRGRSTATANVDGKLSSKQVSRRAWKGLEYWIRDHGLPKSTPYRFSQDESTEMDKMRAVAGITERSRYSLVEKASNTKVKRVKLTLPSREYQSGSGNKSAMPRSLGTGSSGGYEEPAKDGEFDKIEPKDSQKEPAELEVEPDNGDSMPRMAAKAPAEAPPSEEDPPEDEDEEEEEEEEEEEAQESASYRVAHLL